MANYEVHNVVRSFFISALILIPCNFESSDPKSADSILSF